MFRCLSAELQEAINRRDTMEELLNEGSRWEDDEIDVLKEVIKGRRPMTYKEENHVLAEAQDRLRRSAKSIKRKAVGIGMGNCVDYWANNGGH